MACLTEIKSAISYDCDGGAVGIVSALLINKADIESFTFDAANTASVINVTLKQGKTGYKIDTIKRTLVVNETMKANEGAPNAFSHTATVIVTSGTASTLFQDLINPMANGSFVILTRINRWPGASDIARPYGLYYGMSATAIERSTHDNGGWYTITMATPDRVIGEDALTLSIAAYNSLYNTAVG